VSAETATLEHCQNCSCVSEGAGPGDSAAGAGAPEPAGTLGAASAFDALAGTAAEIGVLPDDPAVAAGAIGAGGAVAVIALAVVGAVVGATTATGPGIGVGVAICASAAALNQRLESRQVVALDLIQVQMAGLHRKFWWQKRVYTWRQTISTGCPQRAARLCPASK
jgi:hypothetical protein